MATINKVPVLWGGIPAMPGYSLFYSQAASDATADLVTFFNAIKALFPSGLTWNVPPAGDQLSDADGSIVGSWVGAGAGTVTATAAGAFAAGCGCFTNWRTASIVRRRRLRGHTFLCPLATANYDTSGTIASGALTTINTAAATLAAAGKLVVWSRPNAALGYIGSSSLITAGTIPDQVTSLRSRRS